MNALPLAACAAAIPLAAKEKRGWYGVDLDGTLAEYDGWQGIEHIGAPVPLMMDRVRVMLAEGKEVRIMTARSFRLLDNKPGTPGHEEGREAVRHIQDWLESHRLPRLHVTCVKDFGMIELFDDRCVQIIPNTGIRADGLP